MPDVIALVREFGSFGVLLWLVVWTGPRVLAEMRRTRETLTELVAEIRGATPLPKLDDVRGARIGNRTQGG